MKKTVCGLRHIFFFLIFFVDTCSIVTKANLSRNDWHFSPCLLLPTRVAYGIAYPCCIRDWLPTLRMGLPLLLPTRVAYRTAHPCCIWDCLCYCLPVLQTGLVLLLPSQVTHGIVTRSVTCLAPLPPCLSLPPLVSPGLMLLQGIGVN